MPGKTQRKFVCETMQIQKTLKRPLFFLAEILPCEYTDNDLLELFKEFYPFEWKMIVERCKQSHEKDDFLKNVGKKRRYKTPSAESFFRSIPAVRTILNPKFKQRHKDSFVESVRKSKYNDLKKKRDAKNNAIQQRIAKNCLFLRIRPRIPMTSGQASYDIRPGIPMTSGQAVNLMNMTFNKYSK